MCGIAGSFPEIDPNQIASSVERLTHRGPDDIDLPRYVVPHTKLDSPVNFEKPAAAPQLARAADS